MDLKSNIFSNVDALLVSFVNANNFQHYPSFKKYLRHHFLISPLILFGGLEKLFDLLKIVAELLYNEEHEI